MSLSIEYDKAGKADVKHAFLSKLPASHLYYISNEDSEDWFSYLSAKDACSGRADAKKLCEFSYIRYPLDDFKVQISSIMKKAKSFIDVGCGGGDKLAIIKENWPHCIVHGVEHDPTMAIWARLYADEVFCQDAMTIDYHPYDVIYSYWPIYNHVLMNKLIDHIEATKRKEAIFLLLGYRRSYKEQKDAKSTQESS